ncbi:GPI-anchor transamidase-like [Corticium candelabrum]|uniref:GPI-anchor transamidase-like n=1 Tax=Corticium candelabrum TaxID=121492 RepID=UPI002E2658CA|nr:GPI-anchor transamidase-like [Corticium candelabrum]
MWARIVQLALVCVVVERSRQDSAHTNNWAVIVCSSRYWFNYRHVANALSIYRSVKRLGIPDSQIILMLSDDIACNPRNPIPGAIFNSAGDRLNVYGDDVEVDYRGYEVTVENVIRVLTGRVPPDTPRSKRLLSDERSNVLVYLTGHGGDGFLKFQDSEEIASVELANTFEQMWQKRRYHELFFMIDTCQAVSMYQKFYSPNILAAASSQIGQDSLSHNADPEIGVYMIDRFTYYTLRFLEQVTATSKATMGQLFRSYDASLVMSKPGFRTDLFRRNIDEVLITDFLGSVRNVQLMHGRPVVVTSNRNVNNQSDASNRKQTSWSSQHNDIVEERTGRQQWADSLQFYVLLVVFLTAVMLMFYFRL